MHHPRQEEIYACWRARLGCETLAFTQPGTTVVVNRAGRYGDILVFRHLTFSAVLVHPCLSEPLERLLHRLPNREGVGVEDLTGLSRFGPFHRLPSTELRYLVPHEFRRAERGSVRPLTDEDEEAFVEFCRLCRAEDRFIAEMSLDDPLVMGAFCSGELAACASLFPIDECVLGVSVITGEAYRGLGLAKSVVSAACEWALANDRIVQYEVASSNLASQRLTDSLGFVRFAVEESASVSIDPFSHPGDVDL